MKILNSSCAVKFKRILLIDVKIYSKIQSILGTSFKDLLPTPFQDNNLPPDIPRYTAKSYYGHTEISVALNQVLLQINFDGEYKKDYNIAAEYIKEKLDLVKKVATVLSESFDFSGLSVNIQFDENEISQEFISALNKQKEFMCSKPLFEFDHKFTFIQDKYDYINIRFSNPVETITKHEKIELMDLQKGISVFIDINDRHGFNFKKGYQSSIDIIDKHFRNLNNVVKNKITKIISGEQVNL